MTPHIEAKKDEIAKVVIISGDPVRTKLMAKKYLKDFKLVNTVRNSFIYTGTFQGEKISFATSGMGQASIGIYSFELFSFYDVELILRTGSCGSLNSKIKCGDILNITKAYSFSEYLSTLNKQKIFSNANKVNNLIKQAANLTKISFHNDISCISEQEFYEQDFAKKIALTDIYRLEAVEMEAYSLFKNASFFNRLAGCLLTVSDELSLTLDSIAVNAKLTSEERSNNFNQMFELALKTAILFYKEK